MGCWLTQRAKIPEPDEAMELARLSKWEGTDDDVNCSNIDARSQVTMEMWSMWSWSTGTSTGREHAPEEVTPPRKRKKKVYFTRRTLVLARQPGE